MSEYDERLPRGPKGDRGQQGVPGPGMTPGARHAVAFLFIFAIVLAAANLFWTAHQVHVSTNAQQREQAAQRRQGRILGEKLCATFHGLAELKPPAGNPATNPSRAFEQELHAKLDQLGADLGCR